MINIFESQEQMDETLSKWRDVFELDDYMILAEYVPFETLNAPGLNCGTFISSVKGGWKSPLVIQLANDWRHYKNKSVHGRCDELTLVKELCRIKDRLITYPEHYAGARFSV